MKIYPTIFFLLFFIINSFAQPGSDAKILQYRLVASRDSIRAGDEFSITLDVETLPGLHINSNQPNLDFMIPTEVKMTPSAEFHFNQIQYPTPQLKKFPFSEESMAVLQGRFQIVIPVRSRADVTVGIRQIKGIFSYQGCTDTMCYPPQEEAFEFKVFIVESESSLAQNQPEMSEKAGQDVKEPTLFSADELKAQQILERGLFYALVSFFIIGLALNLTPCVYPVIPITVSYFGSQDNKDKRYTFFNALVYQTGIALAFAVLGLVSGLAGKQWGFLFTSPWFVVIISLVILAMAASLFGSFEIAVPGWLLTKVVKTRQGIMGSLVMGLTVGVVIAPCAAGIIIGLVGLVAKLGLIFQGALFFFVMGMGLGVPYLILATFSGLLNRLPQSGQWMIWIRKLFAFLLIGVALYFLMPQVNRIHDKILFMIGFLALYAGLFLGFLDHGSGYSKTFKRVKAGIGVLLMALGLYWTHSAIQAKTDEIKWIDYNGQKIQEFVKNERPVFFDFYADWCAPCKQLDRETFPHPDIVKLAESIQMIKVDCTAPDENITKLKNQLNILGMPTLVFMSRSGVELSNLRTTGFIPASQLREYLQTTIDAP